MPESGKDELQLTCGAQTLAVEAPELGNVIAAINELLVATPETRRWCRIDEGPEGHEGFVFLDEVTARWLGLL